MADPDLLALVKQIRADAVALRRAAQEADVELATMVALARSKRRRPAREGYGSRLGQRADEPGEDRQVGVQPDAIRSTDSEW